MALRPDLRAELLVAEDDPDDRDLIVQAWARVSSARVLRVLSDGRAMVQHLDRVAKGEEPLPGMLVVDMHMPHVSGADVLREIQRRPELAGIPVVALSANPDEAHECYALGSTAFIAKPSTFDGMVRIFQALDDLCASDLRRRDQVEIEADTADELPALAGLEPARSPAMLDLRRRLARVVRTDLPVLIQGESGTGKERVARIVHAGGCRAAGPWEAENCAAIAPDLIESELFGHVRGAFTGAIGDKVGLFERAHRGTLFLDEIGELPLAVQSKLLRVLEEGAVRPVGAGDKRDVDVRVVAATNRDLAAMCRDGQFREDLFFRLAVLRLEVPPLRDRVEDLRPLVDALVREIAGDPEALELTAPAWGALAVHSWPGNIRELRNLLQRLTLFGGRGTPVGVDVIERELGRDYDPREGAVASVAPDFHAAQGRFNVHYLESLMRQCKGEVMEAAAIAGVSRATLYRQLRRAGLRPGDYR